MMLRCSRCGGQIAEETLAWRCGCGGYLNCPEESFRYAPDPSRSGIWRYASSLPVADPDHPVSLGEGMTPLVSAEWEYAGGKAPVLCKLESLSPSGSYKDRGIAVLVSRIRELGVRKIAEDSSGNAGASMAAYCAAAGIACDVYVPESTSEGKCVQIAAYGANLVRVPGPREATTEATLEAAKTVYYASHNWSPSYPLGLKTWALEVFEQAGGMPDTALCPAGQGSPVRGPEAGSPAMARSGEAPRVPRLCGAQAPPAPPLHQAWKRDAKEPPPARPEPILAERILSAMPVRGDYTLHAVRQSGGALAAVSEKAIWDAFTEAAAKGFYMEPTSAVAFAGLTQFLDGGVIKPGEKSVVLVSGFGLKATDKIMALRASPPV